MKYLITFTSGADTFDFGGDTYEQLAEAERFVEQWRSDPDGRLILNLHTGVFAGPYRDITYARLEVWR